MTFLRKSATSAGAGPPPWAKSGLPPPEPPIVAATSFTRVEALNFPPGTVEEEIKEILPSEDVREAMRQTTFPLLGENDSIEEGRKNLRELLKTHFLKL